MPRLKLLAPLLIGRLIGSVRPVAAVPAGTGLVLANDPRLRTNRCAAADACCTPVTFRREVWKTISQLKDFR